MKIELSPKIRDNSIFDGMTKIIPQENAVKNFFNILKRPGNPSEDFCDLEGDFCERDVSFVLHQVIKEIPIVYADDYDGVPYILYCPTYPWNLTEDEIVLTRGKLKAIFQKYIAILTDDVINIGLQEVENGG